MTTRSDHADIVADPEWLLHRYDEAADAFRFVHAPRDVHRKATFLLDEFLPGAARPRAVARGEAVALAPAPAPLHFIFHSAFCCSSLLARAFDIEGVAMGLKEPQVLNDLHGWRRRGAAPRQVTERLDQAMTLLSKPFAAGETVIVKPSNLVNPFAPAMLAMRPAARALLLYASLPLFLNSIARKGMWGRLWVRELYGKLRKDGVADYGFSADDILGQTDLQVAALGWLAQHRLFASMVSRFGPERVATLDSETLLARPRDAVARLAALFGVRVDVDAVATGPAFTRHSKSDDAFGAEARAAEQAAAAAVHAEEITMVAQWAEAVARSQGQSLTLGAPLLG